MRNDRLNEYINRADKVINPAKDFEWFKMCIDAVKTKNGEEIIKESLEIMESLESCSVEEVAEDFLNKDYEHNLGLKILNIVLNYSFKGPEFVENVMGDTLSENDLIAIQEIKEKNKNNNLQI